MKAIRYLVYAFVGFILRPFFKIDNNIVLFGSRGGVAFEGNGKYLYLHSCQNSSKRSIWVTKSYEVLDEVRSYGYEAYHYLSFSGFKFCLIAGKVHITHSIWDCAPILWRKGQTIIDLWHGIPLKKVAFSDKNISNRSRIMDLYKSARLDYLIAHNDNSINIYSDNFKVSKDKILGLGSPRIEYLSKTERINSFNGLNLEIFNDIYLYAPTFRDYHYDDPFLHKEFLVRVDNFLKTNNCFLFIKLHPLIKTLNYENFNNICIVSSDKDVYEMLPFTDVLITDYSGLSADFKSAYPHKRLLIFTPDLEKYTEFRGFNIDLLSSFSYLATECEVEMITRESIPLNPFCKAKYLNACDNILNIN